MNRDDLSALFSRAHTAQRSVLTVYLNVGQSKRENINRGFEARLKKMVSTARKALVDVAELERYDDARHRITDFISVYRPSAKAIVVFYDSTDGFFGHYELEFSVPEKLHWGRELLLQPLANAIDELEGYGVVLVDRANLRLFAVTLGKIEEIRHEARDVKGVRHLKTTGTDQAGSSSRAQRRADNQIRWNLRHVGGELDVLAKSRKLRRFVLAGTPEITGELRNLLPARLALSVIGEVAIPMDAATKDVLVRTQPIAQKYERDTEDEKVANVVTSALKDDKAVVGLSRTLKAVNADRVWELIYAGDYLSPGFECSQCSALFAARATRCPYCDARLQPVTNVVERAVEHAVRRQAKVEVVTGNASAALKKMAGGIGALLKTRTGSVEV